ncbi:hypothetical protein [Streptomyces sp. G45]|uniref:hypothetical protein n=1 Tax=Streptomyces sp. G45 TaxID=3406627 RepID=UPI003C13E1A8
MKPLTSIGARRSATSARLLRLFVMSGILTVLVTRAFLALAGYPKLGSKDPDATVHISHMLWGGLLMTVSQVALLGLSGRRLRMWASAVGGVGFGLFIDQVGKQVSNEGYLYAPAAGLIYLSFAVLVAIAWRAEDSPPPAQRGPSSAGGAPGDGTPSDDTPGGGASDNGASDGAEREAAATRTSQAAELLLHGMDGGLTAAERARAQQLLEGSQAPTDRALLAALGSVPERVPRPRPWLDAWQSLGRRFSGMTGHTGVVRAAVVLVVVMGFLRLGRLAASGLGGPDSEREWNALVAALACATVTWGLYLYGVRMLRRDRPAAFRALRTGLLIDLLPGQVLNFTIHQFSAVQDLVIDVLLLGVVTAELQRMAGPSQPLAAPRCSQPPHTSDRARRGHIPVRPEPWPPAPAVPIPRAALRAQGLVPSQGIVRLPSAVPSGTEDAPAR